MDSATIYRYLHMLGEQGSFSAAAKVLAISQPSLSGYIKKLETQYGAQLVDRGAQPLRLTAEGRALLDYARRAGLLERELSRQLADLSELARGELVLGGSSCFNSSYLPRAVALFHQRYPGIRIRLVDATVPALVEKTVEGAVDLFLAPEGEWVEGLHYAPLFAEAVVLCVPEDWEVNTAYAEYRIPPDALYKLSQRQDLRPVPLEILRGLPFIILPENQFIGALAQDLYATLGTPCQTVVEAEQMMTSYAMTCAGVGASLITETALFYGNYRQSPALYALPAGHYHRAMYAVCDRSKANSKLCTAFLQALKDALHDYIPSE